MTGRIKEKQLLELSSDKDIIDEVVILFEQKARELVRRHPYLAEEEFLGLYNGDRDQEHQANVQSKLHALMALILLHRTPITDED